MVVAGMPRLLDGPSNDLVKCTGKGYAFMDVAIAIREFSVTIAAYRRGRSSILFGGR